MDANLLRVLIVDDEENTRNLIKICIDWSEIGIEIVGEASSGTEALDYLENNNIDIIITDIQMPFMDGLEFSSIVVERYPHVKIIVLTAYEEFEYAKKGIKIGISDFLLKPIKRQDLRKAVVDLENEIQAERISINEYSKLKAQLSENFNYIKEKFLNDLLQKSHLSDNIKDKLIYFSIESLLNHIQIALISIYPCDIDMDVREEKRVLLDLACVEIVKRYFKNNMDVNIFIDNSRRIVILNSNPAIDVIHCCEQIKDLVINGLKCQICIGIGNIYNDFKSIKKSYKEAYEALKYKVVYGKNHVVCFSDINISNKNLDVKIDEINEIGFYVKAGIEEKSVDIIEKIFNDLTIIGNYNLEQIRVISVNIATIILNSITELGLNYDDILESSNLPYNYVLRIDNIPEMKEYLNKFVLCVIKAIKGARAKKTNKNLTDIIQYLQENISNSELSLSSVANEFYFNSSYLSRIFKLEIGHTFVEYLTMIRIEKAMVLFKETGLKAYEIGESIGIPDPNYFGKCFKKYTSMSVNDYKKIE